MNEPNQEVEIREKMQKLARGVQEELPPHWGFIIMCFPLDDKQGRLNYVSNGKREDVLQLLKEFLYRNRHPGEWNSHRDAINPHDSN
jgi:hypothetical protein